MSSFIAVEGLIGVGKTSLCRLLEKRLEADLILEPADDNPFLSNFYSDPDRFAFPTQMFYLATRCKQQSRLMQPSLFSKIFVSDYLFEKDRIFAKMTLMGEELDLYDRFAALLQQAVAVPDFILFLDAPTEVIMSRIKRRGIEAEQAIQESYIEDLRQRYFDLWRTYDRAPIYVLDTTSIDYIDDPDAQDLMIDIVKGWLKGEPHPAAPAAFTGELHHQMSIFDALVMDGISK